MGRRILEREPELAILGAAVKEAARGAGSVALVDRRAVIVVERDDHVIERHQVVGRLEGVRLARQLRSHHRGPEARR